MKKAVVVGAGKSGLASARRLSEKRYRVFITELKAEEDIKVCLEPLFKEAIIKEEDVEFGSHTERFVNDADLMVVSPGVGSGSLPIKFAEKRNIPIISELELGYSMCPAPIIAITGTSGKTTVTTLIGQMLERAGKDVIVCGNIGNPLTGELNRIKSSSIVVLEVSSFQLERIKNFRPKASVILNISANHLDRHKDFEEYVMMKSRIFSNQKHGDILFINGKDALLRELSKDAKCRVLFFDEYKGFRIRLGVENENFLASMSVASFEGASEEIMKDVLHNFRGIEHRLEYVTTINGVDFINDSKATTVSSVEWALRSLEGKIVLIMGGRYKGGDFGKLGYLIKQKAARVIAIGEAKERIKTELLAFTEVMAAGTLEEAVNRAFEIAVRGNKVLLSPGCSSFDMFKNYEERGRAFKVIARSISLNSATKQSLF